MEITQGNVLNFQPSELRSDLNSKTISAVDDVGLEEDPVLVQSMRGIVLTAAHVLAGATDSEESEW